MTIDEILSKAGLTYEELNATERETLYSMLDAVNKSAITINKFRDYIQTMRDSIEVELINEPEFHRVFLFRIENRKQILLKARLRNYMLIGAFLDSPRKAQEAVERAIGGSIRKGK